MIPHVYEKEKRRKYFLIYRLILQITNTESANQTLFQNLTFSQQVFKSHILIKKRFLMLLSSFTKTINVRKMHTISNSNTNSTYYCSEHISQSKWILDLINALLTADYGMYKRCCVSFIDLPSLRSNLISSLTVLEMVTSYQQSHRSLLTTNLSGAVSQSVLRNLGELFAPHE